MSDLQYIFNYVDDILVFSDTVEDHLFHLLTVFTRLLEQGLTVNRQKCDFLATEIAFLGHCLKQGVFTPIEERIEMFKKLQRPKTINAMRLVLETFNFYRQFIKQAATSLATLNDVLKGHTRKTNRTLIR